MDNVQCLLVLYKKKNGNLKSEDLELIGCICCSVAKSLLTLCDPMDCSTPGFPILHYLLEFAQTEKLMATHTSDLAWRIPGMGEPGGLPSMGSHRVGHDWSDLAAAAAPRPLSQWCYSTISSSVAHFSSCLQSFPASGSFLRNHFASSGQTVASSSASVLPRNIQCWFPLGLTGLIFLLSKGLSRVFSSTTIWKHQSSMLCHSALFFN